MQVTRFGIALAAGAIVLGGCAVVPQGPTVRVYPPPTKPFEVFVAEDQSCRGYALQMSGDAQQAANNAAVGSAVVGTAVGAAAGALVGGHEGAGVGAGTGLIMGSAIGAGESSRAGWGAQRRYDYAYAQCMYAKGNWLPMGPAPYYYGYGSPPPPPPAALPPPPPPPGPPPAPPPQ